MVTSMRLKEKPKIKVLKSLISDVNYSLKSETPLAPMDILLKSIKKRSYAEELYRKSDRGDLADTEQIEISILEKYLDKRKTEEEIVAIIQKVIKENPKLSSRTKGPDFGLLMKHLTQELNAAQAPREGLIRLVKREITRALKAQQLMERQIQAGYIQENKT